MTPASATTQSTSTGSATTNGSAPSAQERVAQLRHQAESDPAAAQHGAWGWIRQLGDLAGRDRDSSDRQLNELFRLGTPVHGLDGPTEGILVAPFSQPIADHALRALSSVWMPWQGKRFDAANDRGINMFTDSVRLPAKLIWPTYSTQDDPDGGRLAFRFNTFVEAGKDDPDREVLVIDYVSVDENPRILIKSIRDELVEICPGTYLGKVLYRRGEDRYSNLGYFALRQRQ